MREFLATVAAILIIIITLCGIAWLIGLLGTFIGSLGISENVVFFIVGFSVGCFRKRICEWLMTYSERVFRTITDRFYR